MSAVNPSETSVGVVPQRIDALLAMAYFWGAEPAGVRSQVQLNHAEQTAWERRVLQITQLASPERKRWMEMVLRLPRHTDSDEELAAQVEPIHPSRWLPLLKNESLVLQAGVLRLLPADVADSLRRALGQAQDKEDAETALPIDPGLRRFLLQPLLRRFIQLTDVPQSTELDHLSRAQLPQFLRERGRREIAIACRGIAELETLSAFLRRFAATDATAIGQQLQGLRWLSPERVEVAQMILQSFMGGRFDASLLINQVGLDVLAIALLDSPRIRAQFTLQKLGPQTADFLSQRIAFWQTSPSAMLARKTVAETDELAVQMRLAATK